MALQQTAAATAPPTLRKGPHSAVTVTAAGAESSGTVFLGKQRSGRRGTKPTANRRYTVGEFVHEQDREIILQQLFRCLGKYDPRAIPRIISKRTGITEQAVDFVFQQTCHEFRQWSREVRAGIARADVVAAACWKRGAA